MIMIFYFINVMIFVFIRNSFPSHAKSHYVQLRKIAYLFVDDPAKF